MTNPKCITCGGTGVVTDVLNWEARNCQACNVDVPEAEVPLPKKFCSTCGNTQMVRSPEPPFALYPCLACGEPEDAPFPEKGKCPTCGGTQIDPFDDNLPCPTCVRSKVVEFQPKGGRNDSVLERLDEVREAYVRGEISSVALATVGPDGTINYSCSEIPNYSLMIGAISRMWLKITKQAEDL
jgi:hypothetical protein